MTAVNFSKCLARILVHEGGLVDDKRDKGGRTAYGVTQRAYDAYRDSKKQGRRDVYKIDKVEIGNIYRTRYWNVIGADKLPSGVDYVVFDGAVNSGTAQSVKWLQRALGTRYHGKIDGQMGMLTLNAVVDFPNHDKLIELICSRRRAFLHALTTYNYFGKGWMNRVNAVEKAGQAMATGSTVPEAQPIALATFKANIEDAKPLPVKAVGDVAGGSGGALAAVSQGIDQTKEQLVQVPDVPFVSKILLGVTLLGIILFVGGFGWRWLMARKEAALKDALDLEAAPDRSADAT